MFYCLATSPKNAHQTFKQKLKQSKKCSCTLSNIVQRILFIDLVKKQRLMAWQNAQKLLDEQISDVEQTMFYYLART